MTRRFLFSLLTAAAAGVRGGLAAVIARKPAPEPLSDWERGVSLCSCKACAELLARAQREREEWLQREIW
jgi:hypothetical protein